MERALSIKSEFNQNCSNEVLIYNLLVCVVFIGWVRSNVHGVLYKSSLVIAFFLNYRVDV